MNWLLSGSLLKLFIVWHVYCIFIRVTSNEAIINWIIKIRLLKKWRSYLKWRL